ncbi:MAG TPA: dipeptide epimerase [Streptosporangiaceae bacterium]|jgi:L-alanine-DL-glutamate epimerase-like enolase superfamily enzyme
MAALQRQFGPEASTAAERARTIARLDIAPIAVRLNESFAISKGAVATAQNVLVRVVLQDGSAGYGEAAPFEVITGETQASTLTALQTMIGIVTGRDAAGWRVLAADLRGLLPGAAAARCAVEQAVVDALARHLGLSLPAFFGGLPHELMTDITIPVGDVKHSVESAHHAEEAGFKTVKVKVGDDWELDVARVAAISQATPALSIIVDGNAGFSRSQAHRFLGGVTEAGAAVVLVEQPVAAPDIAGLAELEREHGIPVCADESVRCPEDAIRVAESGISSVNVKLMKCGVADALDIISVARSAGMTGMIGGMVETAVAMTFSAAVAAASYPFFTYIDLDTPLLMPRRFVRGGMRYNGPTIRVPGHATGTGVDAAAHFAAKSPG